MNELWNRPDDDDLRSAVRRLIEVRLAEKYTEMAYALTLDGSPVIRDALGHFGGDEQTPASPDDTFNVASVSKIYTTVAVMQLVERGGLNLDVPVARWLPRFRTLDGGERTITLRHCLSHTSGLPGTQWRNFSVTTPDDRALYYDDVYDYLSRSRLKAAPGTYAVYCNDGFTLAEMAVAAVSGLPFGAYCRRNITEPLGAISTRLAMEHNETYRLAHEKNKPAELLLIGGGAGFTTTMTDLCRFGGLFLEPDGKVVTAAMAAEMARPQGATFLSGDDRSPLYGLGWDTVAFADPDWDLGDGVLVKGGNSFQFTTTFLIVPRHRAVIALSETHDCKLDVRDLALRVLSMALERRGVHLARRARPLTGPARKLCESSWLAPSGVFALRASGGVADLVRRHQSKPERPYALGLRWNGGAFEADDGTTYWFETSGDDVFLMETLRGRTAPIAQTVRPKEPNAAWDARAGHLWLVDDADPSDLVVHEMMTAFRLAVLPDLPGVYLFSFSTLDDGDVYSSFDGPVEALDENRGRGFLSTPCNGSRDLLDPEFAIEGGVPVCRVASYHYRDAADLPAWSDQPFPTERRHNGLYKIATRLDDLPEVPEDHRLLVLDEDGHVVYDSLFPETPFKPRTDGYLILI